jgi:tetratricopeptide (TPR) repeat protein
LANKQGDVKGKIEYYSETANLLLGEEAYDIASDFFTLAGYYSTSVGDSASARSFTEKAIESCRKGNIQDHHYLFALSLKELTSGNFDKAVEYWNSAKSKYTEDEVELVEQVLNAHKTLLPQEKTDEETLETFLEETKNTEDKPSMEAFEKIAFETSEQEPQTSKVMPQKTATPYWTGSEPQPLIEKRATPQPETTIQEPSEEWQLVSQPLESTQITPPKTKPTLEEKPETLVAKPKITQPAPKTTISPKPSLKLPTPPVAPSVAPPSRPRKEVSVSTPKAAISPAAIHREPIPTYTEPAVTPKIGTPAKPIPQAQIAGKNIYGRIKISEMAWRVSKTDSDLTEALSNLINQGKIPGYIQGDEYIQTPDEALTKLSTRGSGLAPSAEASSQFFTTSEADVSAKTREGYKRCGVCGTEIPNWTKICPKCGAKQ